MRLDRLTVHLRARSSWEAVELGTALVRRHAAAIWKPWLLLTLPLFALSNLGFVLLGAPLLAGVAMWWLKPLFDRVPLYVISRATFGNTPSTGETLRAQWRWGLRPMLHYLSWRRFGPVRSLFLPIDLLEGGSGAALRERRRVLGGVAYASAAMLTLACMGFTFALMIGCVAGILMFVPFDQMPEAIRAGWALVGEDTPWWVLVGCNAIAWLATSIVEPFYVGGGFGLYLNRRTQLEAWDVEIAFRRLRRRLQSAAAALAVLLAVVLGGVPGVSAQAGATPGAVDEADASSRGPAVTPGELFGEQYDAKADFGPAVRKAYEDPLLQDKQVVKRWAQRRPSEVELPEYDLGWMKGLARLFAVVGEWALWILAGIAVLALVLCLRWWWPRMRAGARRGKAEAPARVEVEALPLPDALPDNVVAAARRLWGEGRHRHALALLYRASVDSMAARANVVLAPGATEAECLRASRRQPVAEDREAFASMVRTWQYAAYAQRLPGQDEFEALLARLQQRYGWAA